jgi:uncharacterized protein (DUF1697 family)
MALVVLLKGVNVGGHRAFRPAALAGHLKYLDVVNVGAAGTFVVRGRVTVSQLRTEFQQQLPFRCDIMICPGRDILDLAATDPFSAQRRAANIIQFVSVLARATRSATPLPLDIPPSGKWFVRILAQHGRFVLGLHRREMKAIGYLGEIERIFGAPATTRSWSTILTIAQVLANG